MADEKKAEIDNKKIVTIDGVQYDLDSLPAEVKTMLTNIHIVDSEINHLQALLGIARTARGTYAAALKAQLDKLPK